MKSPSDPYDAPSDSTPIPPVTPQGSAWRSDPLAHNCCALIAYQIALRVGWIFKTESIIIPAFLDAIGGTALLRGFLPVLQRFGTSIPPVLFARRLKLMGRKKWALALTSVGMGVPFLVLGWLWLANMGRRGIVTAGWWPYVFLSIYAIAFVCIGMNRLAMDTVQGKLIPATSRGRLFALSIGMGAPLAIGAAWWKLDDWLALESGFGFVFIFSGVLFLVMALVALLLREARDHYTDTGNGLARYFHDAWDLIRGDRDFRKLAIVAGLASMLLMILPHYQAFGRERLDLEYSHLMFWVVIQHLGVVLFSLLAGPLADRSGNRRALHYTVFGGAMAPLVAIVLPALGTHWGGILYWLVFLSVGLTPVTIRLMTNYALELAPPSEHPRYISTLGLCFAIPVMAGALPIGWLIDAVGYPPVFLGGFFLIGLGGWMTFWLAEPRHRQKEFIEALQSTPDV